MNIPKLETQIRKKNWAEFYNSMAMGIANFILRPLGWVIVACKEIDDDYNERIVDAFPATYRRKLR